MARRRAEAYRMKVIKRRKRLSVLAFVFLFAFCADAYAHPPKQVSLGWNQNGELTVNVAHSVDSPDKHYINRITVYADNKMIANKDYQAQTSAESLTDVFALGALPSGANVKVEAFCVIMGSAAGSIIVP